MNKKLITLLLLVIPIFLVAQDKSECNFFQDINLKEKARENEANYKVISTTTDKNSIKKLIEIKTNKIIWSKSYHNKKPYGTWLYWNNKYARTDSIIYGKNKPEGCYSYDIVNQKLIDLVRGDFTKPKLIGVDETIVIKAIQLHISDIAVWISINVNYPMEAQLNDIQGKVQTQFTVDENGVVGDIRITDGVDKLLDLESYKLLNLLPKMKPATLNGKPIKLYIEAPINFLLRSN